MHTSKQRSRPVLRRARRNKRNKKLSDEVNVCLLRISLRMDWRGISRSHKHTKGERERYKDRIKESVHSSTRKVNHINRSQTLSLNTIDEIVNGIRRKLLYIIDQSCNNLTHASPTMNRASNHLSRTRKNKRGENKRNGLIEMCECERVLWINLLILAINVLGFPNICWLFWLQFVLVLCLPSLSVCVWVRESSATPTFVDERVTECDFEELEFGLEEYSLENFNLSRFLLRNY